MAQPQWHIQRQPGALTLSRQLPARFDVQASCVLPCVSEALSLSRMAHQIRQDLWRALQEVRGFSPVVHLEAVDGALRIQAGGQAPYPRAPRLSEVVAELIEDPQRHQRWLRHAARRCASAEGRL